MSVMREQKKGKILQYGERVFGIREGSEDERIDRTIRATEEFFRSLGLATRLHELQIGQIRSTRSSVASTSAAPGWAKRATSRAT
mgnify:CR=1 FL=1